MRVKRMCALGIDVSTRCPGLAGVVADLATGPKGQIEAVTWTFVSGSADSVPSGTSVLQTGTATTLSAARHWAGLNPADGDTMAVGAVEGFMMNFAAGRFRTQGLFLLAQLNGIVSHGLWQTTGAPPLVLMPNAVRGVLDIPSAGSAEEEEEVLWARAEEAGAPPRGGPASAAVTPVKRAVLRRVAATMTGPVKWPMARSAAAPAAGRAALSALETADGAAPEAFDMADAAALGVAATLHGVMAVMALRPDALEAALDAARTPKADPRAITPGDGTRGCDDGGCSGACRAECPESVAARLGALVVSHSTKAAVAAFLGAPEGQRRRCAVAVGTAWMEAVDGACLSARAGHGGKPTEWPAGGREQAQAAGARPPGVPDGCGGSGRAAAAIASVGAWPWGGVSAESRAGAEAALAKAAAAARSTRTRQTTRMGLTVDDAPVLEPIVPALGLGITAAAKAVRAEAKRLLREAQSAPLS